MILVLACTTPQQTDDVQTVDDSSQLLDSRDGPDSAEPDLHWIDLAVGTAFGCGITSRGQVKCWGHPDLGRTEGAEGTEFTEVVAGIHHACAVAPGGLECWGSDHSQEPVPDLEGEFTYVGAGGHRVCGVTTEQILCGGTYSQNDSSVLESELQGASGLVVGLGQTTCIERAGEPLLCVDPNDDEGTTPAPDVVLRQAQVTTFGCGLAADSSLACWGDIHPELEAIPSQPIHDFSLAEGYGCFIHADEKSLSCWGSKPLVETVLDPPDGTFEDVEVGLHHACALSSDGEIVCWGTPPDRYDFGQLAVPDL